MTSLGGKTGRLTLFDEDGATVGELAFRDGRLVGAVCGELGAEKAFYALLDLSDGAFDFELATELDDENCDLPTQSLLMEGMRRLDELRRLRCELPASARVKLIGGEAEDELEARVLGYSGRRRGPSATSSKACCRAETPTNTMPSGPCRELAARGTSFGSRRAARATRQRKLTWRAPQPELER